MQLGNAINTDSMSRRRLRLPRIVEAGLRAVISLWLFLGPALSLPGLSQVNPPPHEPTGGNLKRQHVCVLNFQDESGTGATDELGRWLGSYLAKHLVHVSKHGLSAQFFNWENDPASIKEWPTKRVLAVGQKLRAQFVVRAGLLSAISDRIQGRVRTRIQLYAEVLFVEKATEVRVEARGVGYQPGEDSDPTIAWDSIDFRSGEFGKSSVRNALADAIERLASEIDKEFSSLSSSDVETIDPDQTPDPGRGGQAEQPSEDSADQTLEAQEAASDEGLQQLLAQAQECLNSVNASRERLEALIQALQGLTSAMEQKARLLEEGRVTEIGRVNGVIDAQAGGLQESVDQLLPEEPNDGLTGGAPVESVPGSSWFDKVTRAVDFGFSVFERVLDIRDRLRGLPGGQDLGGPGGPDGLEGSDGVIPSEEPFVDFPGGVFTEGNGPQGRLGDEDPRVVHAVLSGASGLRRQAVFASFRPHEHGVWSTIKAASAGGIGVRRKPVAGAEVIEPDSGAIARTDRSGLFNIRIPARSRRLIVKIGGSQVAERRISVIAGRAIAADFVIGAGAGADGAGRILPSRVVVDSSGANTGTLSGLVQDEQGRPSPRALVEVGRLATARTDSRGRFVFARVPAGAQQLTVRAGDVEPKSEQVRVRANVPTEMTIRLGSRRRSQGVEEKLIAPGAGTILRGEVTEGQNRPVRGASVSVIGHSSTVSAQSTATGKFELKDLKPGSYRVLVSKPGYAPVTQSVSLRPGGNEQTSFRMTPTNSRFELEVVPKLIAAMGEVRGQVRGPDRRPIANAMVRLVIDGKRSGSDRVVTNDHGEYTLKALQGRYELKVLREGYQAYSRSVDLRARDSLRADVELKAGPSTGSGGGSISNRRFGSLRGRVSNDRTDKGITNVRVSAGRSSDTTDGGGNYLMTNLEPGRLQVSITGNGYETKTETVEVRAGSATNRNFELRSRSGSGPEVSPRDGQLRGRVSDDRTDKGIPNVRVSAGRSSDTTDGGGNYLIPNLEPGRLQVSITGNGYETKTETVEVRAGSATNRNFELRSRSGIRPEETRRDGQLRGRVTDDRSGRAISGARVSVQGRSDVTDNSGSYQIDGLPPGRWQITVVRAGYTGESTSVEIKAGRMTNRNFDLKPMNDDLVSNQPGRGGMGQVRGRVVDDKTGRAISGARVSVAGRVDTTDRSGAFEVSRVPAGRHSVSVSKSGYTSANTSVEVKVGASATRNFELKPSGREVHPRDLGGTPPYNPNPRRNPTVKPEPNKDGQGNGVPRGSSRDPGYNDRNQGGTLNRNSRSEKPSPRPKTGFLPSVRSSS